MEGSCEVSLLEGLKPVEIKIKAACKQDLVTEGLKPIIPRIYFVNSRFWHKDVGLPTIWVCSFLFFFFLIYIYIYICTYIYECLLESISNSRLQALLIFPSLSSQKKKCIILANTLSDILQITCRHILNKRFHYKRDSPPPPPPPHLMCELQIWTSFADSTYCTLF